VTLEAWAAGRPVIVDARSPVLAGMTRRARAGLAYRTSAEFAEICELLADRPEVGDRLGRSGAEFVARTYTWPRVVETYVDLFAEVRARLR
jgi:glycosyltransferase involved in cell wall biosynthesis